MKKRNQHYVFQAYLREWKNSTRNLWCLQDGKIFTSGTRKVAQGEDFYRISRLNDDEIKFLQFFWSDKPLTIQKQLFSHLYQYQISFVWEKELALCKKIVEEINNSGSITEQTSNEILDLANYLVKCLKNANDLCNEPEKDLWKKEMDNLTMSLRVAGLAVKNNDNPKVITLFDDNIKRLEEIIDEATNDIEEDFLSSVETETSRWMKALKEQNLSALEQEDKRELFLDISIHYFRTKAARENFKKNFQARLSNASFVEKFQQAYPDINLGNIHVDNIIHLIFWGLQTALATSLYERKAHITLLVNDSSVPFITSDRPVINLKADYKNLSQGAEELVFYYPLSPKIAITVHDCNTSDIVHLNQHDVEEYNEKMFNASHEIIFANEKSVLEKFLSNS